jgi:hypothetical protein
MTKTVAAAFNLSILLATVLGSCTARAESTYQPLSREHDASLAPLHRAAKGPSAATKATVTKEGRITYTHTLEQGGSKTGRTVKVTL